MVIRGLEAGMKNFLLEVCVDSVQSALAAEAGGATRIELCGNLVIGGTIPSPKLFEEIRKHSQIPIHVLIRPRFGDFCYSAYEYKMIKEEVKMFRELGAEGVVIGILKPDGTLNMEEMHGLMEAAGGMSVTLHRAFDMSVDCFQTMEQAISLGIHTILTSGQKNTCRLGSSLLKDLQERSKGRISIMAGGGVDANEIGYLYEVSGITAYHMSGKVNLDSAMKYRREDVSMGLPSLSEYTIYQTSEEKIRVARAVLDKLRIHGSNSI